MSELAIDVSGLCKTFNDTQVVDDVSLQVKAGEIYGFLGPNGSGKTTTLRIICGLLNADAGQGHCMGYDIRKQSYLIKSHIGYMTQHFSLYGDLTIEENLDFMARMYDLDRRKERIAQAIDRLGIGQLRKKQLAGQLSGGWKQRLALAAAMIHEPKVLLLDEPTAGVDPTARREFWDTIHELSGEGITTLVTTHYMDEAERCHRLAYLAYGRLLAKGTSQEIITQAGLTTYEVTGRDLQSLVPQLRALNDVAQVAIFGTRLHVSGLDRAALALAVQPYQGGAWQWQLIEPSLEDVFIYYMNHVDDNFA